MKISDLDWLDSIYKSIKLENLPHGIIINGPKGISDESFLLLSTKLGSTEIRATIEELNITNGIAIQPNQKPMTAKSFASPKPMPSLFLTCL